MVKTRAGTRPVGLEISKSLSGPKTLAPETFATRDSDGRHLETDWLRETVSP